MDGGQLDHGDLARAQEPILHRGISHVDNAHVLTVAVGSEIDGPARFSEHSFHECQCNINRFSTGIGVFLILIEKPYKYR